MNNYNHLSPSRCVFRRLPIPFGKGYKLVERISVARVQPRTSKGITDLFLPQTSLRLETQSPSKKHSTLPKQGSAI